MSEKTEDDKLFDLLQEYVAKLGEHFSEIQVFACKIGSDSDGYVSYGSGLGNIHTRINMAREFIIKHDEQVRMRTRRDEEDDE